MKKQQKYQRIVCPWSACGEFAACGTFIIQYVYFPLPVNMIVVKMCIRLHTHTLTHIRITKYICVCNLEPCNTIPWVTCSHPKHYRISTNAFPSTTRPPHPLDWHVTIAFRIPHTTAVPVYGLQLWKMEALTFDFSKHPTQTESVQGV